MTTLKNNGILLDPVLSVQACLSPGRTSQGGDDVPTAGQRKAFAAALHQALADRRLSGRALARAVGVSAAAVGHWLRAETAPRPDTAARIEAALELDPGTLSQPLGYVIISQTSDGRALSVAEAVQAESRLGPLEKTLLINIYRELLRHHARSAGDPKD
jgi:transcriptional regulator with XRE-family HTH domain